MGFWSNAFGALHLAGKAALTVFGLGAVASSLEKVEANAGLLPSWAGGTLKEVTAPGSSEPSSVQPDPTPSAQPPRRPVVISRPDRVVVIPNGNLAPMDFTMPKYVVIRDGHRFQGNGYKHGARNLRGKFSYGFSAPSQVVVVDATGKVSRAFADVKQAIILAGDVPSVLGGGVPSPAHAVYGDEDQGDT